MTKQNLVELIKNTDKSEFGKTIDLHIHSSFSDGKLTPEQLSRDAEAKGLRYYAIADHNTVDAYKKTSLKNNEKVIPAIEFDCWYRGILVHILGYGIDVNNEELLNLCAKTKKETEADIVRLFNKRRPKNVINAIHNAGGIAILAHPACCWCLNLEHFIKGLVNLGLDGLEAYYPYKRHRGVIKFHFASTVEKTGKKLNLLLTGGSDSHGEIESFVSHLY